MKYLTESVDHIKQRVLTSTLTLTPEVIKAKEESIAVHKILMDNAAFGPDKKAHQDEIDMLQAQLMAVNDVVT